MAVKCMIVFVAEFAQALQPHRGCRPEPALALHGLDHDGGDVRRVDDGDEAVVQLLEVPVDPLVFRERAGTPVEVGEWKAVDLRRIRAEALLAGCESAPACGGQRSREAEGCSLSADYATCEGRRTGRSETDRPGDASSSAEGCIQ